MEEKGNAPWKCPLSSIHLANPFSISQSRGSHAKVALQSQLRKLPLSIFVEPLVSSACSHAWSTDAVVLSYSNGKARAKCAKELRKIQPCVRELPLAPGKRRAKKEKVKAPWLQDVERRQAILPTPFSRLVKDTMRKAGPGLACRLIITFFKRNCFSKQSLKRPLPAFEKLLTLEKVKTAVLRTSS